MHQLSPQGLVAMLSRVERALENAEDNVFPVRRGSTEVLAGKPRSSIVRQITLTKSTSLAKAMESASGQKLHRLYTIDQDAFFPDLPALVSVRVEIFSTAQSNYFGWQLFAILECCGREIANPAVRQETARGHCQEVVLFRQTLNLVIS